MKFAGLFMSTILGTATVVVSMTAFSSEAHARVEICNNSPELISVAYAKAVDNGITSTWTSRGWWNIPGRFQFPAGEVKCAIVDSGSASSIDIEGNVSSVYGPYFYAYSSTWKWFGNTEFCVIRTAFTHTSQNSSIGGGCLPEFFKRSFQKIHSGTLSNYRLNLVADYPICRPNDCP